MFKQLRIDGGFDEVNAKGEKIEQRTKAQINIEVYELEKVFDINFKLCDFYKKHILNELQHS